MLQYYTPGLADCPLCWNNSFLGLQRRFTNFLCYITSDFTLYFYNSFLGLLCMFTDFLCYSTTHQGFGGFSSMLEQFFPGIMNVCSRIFYATVLHTRVWRIFPYTGRIPSRDYYVQVATLINIIEGRFFTGCFVPEDVLSRWTFCPKELMSLRTFWLQPDISTAPMTM
jgi:hypothetical protein